MILAEITTQTRDVVTQSGIGLGSMLAVTFFLDAQNTPMTLLEVEPLPPP